MSAIFYHDEEQKRLAMQTKENLEATLNTTIFTEIVPVPTFYMAEDYHQKYYLQQYSKLVNEFRVIYPNVEDYTNSTAVARANGYAGGYGTEALLQEEIESLGLSQEGKELVMEIAGRGLTPACAVPFKISG